MKKRQLTGEALLLTAALIWGVAFVAQAKGMDYIGPFTFNGIRGLLAAAVLLPAWAVFRLPKTRQAKAQSAALKPALSFRSLGIGAVLCGLMLFCASSLQQIALVTTTAGKAGFLTALYIVLVPVFGVFLHKKVSAWVWAAVVLATAGLYLLCSSGSFAFTAGDLCLLGCAACYAVQILLVDRFAPHMDPMLLCGIQFLVTGVLSLPVMFWLEQPTWAGVWAAAVPLLYTGVLSGAVAFTLQIVGQRNTEPAVASLLMSFESVFSVLAGALLLKERLSASELLGCVLVFSAIVLAQLPGMKKRAALSKDADLQTTEN